MFEQTFKNIDDVLWKEAGCSSELDYTEQTSWMLFLRYLDDLEGERAIEAELVGKRYDFIIDAQHHWSRAELKQSIFRQWATRILREHLTRGWTLDQQRFEANARELEAAMALIQKAAQSPEMQADTVGV